MTQTIDTAVPSLARVEALQSVLKVLTVRPLVAPAWVRDQCRARRGRALAEQAGAPRARRAA